MHFDIVVIGGGSTGTSIFRDLCLRGLDSVLIEKNRISGGTTQHSHHNLVGGMRYVIKDPEVARDCAEENRILQKIAPRIIGSKGNYFIGFRSDYVEEALRQAKKIGVFFKELEISDVYEEVPTVNDKVILQGDPWLP